MMTPLWRRLTFVWMVSFVLVGSPRLVHADEIWVAPTYQQDIGGLGVASNVFWPVTPVGAVRLAWSIPDDLQTFQSAKVVVIPNSPGGASTLNVFVCPAQNGNVVSASCAGPFAQTFTGVANQLVEVDISSLISSSIGTPGANYLAVLAYTTPTTTTDHIVGLRFSYTPKLPTGAATLAANKFTGTQIAPQFSGTFVGNGAGLTSLPFPAGAATLGANTFTGTQTAPAFAGSGALLTGIPVANIVGAATLGTNVFTANQTVHAVSGTAVTGINTAAPGSSNDVGIVGQTAQSQGAGVLALNTNTNGTGLVAAGNNAVGQLLVSGSGLSAVGRVTGVYAGAITGGAGQAIYTNLFGNVVLVNYFDGALQYKINGTGTVSTLVRAPDVDTETHTMFAPEAPEVLFEDYGIGRLSGGRAHIALDPIYSANVVVNDHHPLRVFIQLEGDCQGVYVTNKSAHGFEVVELGQGTSDVAFSWHVVGNRADEEMTDAFSDEVGGDVRVSHYSDARLPVHVGPPSRLRPVRTSSMSLSVGPDSATRP
jgi:hypothetical protein